MTALAQILGFFLSAVVVALVLVPFGVVGFLVGIVGGPVLYLVAWGYIIIGREMHSEGRR